ncbi:MAG: nucleoside deaminase [Thermoanaerobaculia bacterium]|nr:nucleoside deaminase [Thermoanaerobaculia bacterium]
MTYPSLTLQLPPWIHEVIHEVGGDIQRSFVTDEERMGLAVALSARSVEEGGGPFGACVFDDSGHLVAPGVNLVVPAGTSIAHAEMVALALAQQVLGSFDLGADGVARQLVTSTEPCAQCFGAVPWSGVRRVVCGATTEDAEAIGFDEGPKPERWIDELQRRGIEVRLGVLRAEANAVLQDYATRGGPIYNAQTG